MPDDNLLPLQRTTPNVDTQFCDFRTPVDLLDFFVENLLVNATALADALGTSIIFSPTEPTGADIGKVWIKTIGSPRGIGIYVDGAYVIIPIPEDAEQPEAVPAGGIIPYTGATVPEGWNNYPQSAATALGLPVLTSGQWIIRTG